MSLWKQKTQFHREKYWLNTTKKKTSELEKVLIGFHKIHLEKKIFAPFGFHKSTEVQFWREAA